MDTSHGALNEYTMISGRRNPKIWPIFALVDHIATKVPSFLLLKELQKTANVEGNDAKPKNPKTPIEKSNIKYDKPIEIAPDLPGTDIEIIGMIKKAKAAIKQVQRHVSIGLRLLERKNLRKLPIPTVKNIQASVNDKNRLLTPNYFCILTLLKL